MNLFNPSKFFWLILCFIPIFFLTTLPVNAVDISICRNYQQNTVCILKIKRSAKYYWRYRTQISINGVKKPLRIYDCRQNKIWEKDGGAIAFSTQGIEQYICETLYK